MEHVLFESVLYKTKNFSVKFEALNEHRSIDEDLLDESILQETLDSVNSGELVFFCAKVSLRFRGNEIASDYLGTCIYESYEDFVTTHKFEYLYDMVLTVLREGREELKEIKEALNSFK